MNYENSVLLTDLYQLTMLQGYFEQGMDATAVFECFVRDLPKNRGFLMAAGLEQVLQYLEAFRFKPDELEYLKTLGKFSEDFIEFLAQLRFSGDVDAMQEGEVLFANEPILRVTAPIIQAQFVESRILNFLHFQTLIASKAARCVLAGPDKLLVDFGMRRSHGGEAALLAARASYLAGFSGTSTVLAGSMFGIPVYGTMGHAFIEAHDSEEQAFESFAMAQPLATVLLIDTYDTELAANKVVAMAPSLKNKGINLKGVRIDSGDLAMHARKVRQILDQGGLEDVVIFASSSVDENVIFDYVQNDVPIDGFGVGTRLDTSADSPYLDCVYKLQEYAGTPRWKTSEGKATWPGRKQVYRHYDGDGIMQEDVVTLLGESGTGITLLHPVMRQGNRVAESPTLDQSRELSAKSLASLPSALRKLEAYHFKVEISNALRNLTR